MKRFLSLCLAIVMVAGMAISALATEVSDFPIDITIHTTEITVDECYSYTYGEGNIVDYDWYAAASLDVTLNGTDYIGISCHELDQLLWDLFPENNVGIGYGQQNETWEKNTPYECSIMIFFEDQMREFPVTVTVCDTTVTKVEATISPMQNYFGDTIYEGLTVTFADGTVVRQDEYAYYGISFRCQQWPTTPGTHTVSGYLGALPMEAQITVPAYPVTIDSDIVVDALTGWTEYDYSMDIPETYTYYYWEGFGMLDATVYGTKYTDISFYELMEIAGFNSFSMYYPDDDYACFDQSASNPWQLNEYYSLGIEAYDADETPILMQQINVVVRPTQIVSVSAAPVTYYAYRGYADVEFTATYEDGSTKPLGDGYSTVLDQAFPTEPGTYTLTYKVADRFDVPVSVTVLPTPTSGKLGETVSWSIDEATATMTISGTGNATYDGDIERDWFRLLASQNVKHVVVEEGVEGLFDGVFMLAPTLESLSLPASLKELPGGLLGYNGNSAELDIFDGAITTVGVSTLVIPESVTQWDAPAFYGIWSLQDLYLPEGLESVNLENLCHVAVFRQQMEMSQAPFTIHFAGSESQWENVELITLDDPYYEGLYSGLTEDELLAVLDTLTIVFDDPADCYSVPIPVEGGVAIVPDKVVEVEAGEDVVIDATKTEEKAESVVISSQAADKLSQTADVAVEIALPAATVSFDSTAVDTITQAVPNAPVTIVATQVEESTLTPEQTDALTEKEVSMVLNLEVYAGEEKVSDFAGGKVTVSIPFEVPAGKKLSNFYVAYIADDGTITEMRTSYENNMLNFTTTHFSSYVVLEAPTDGSNAETGDATSLMLLMALMVLSGGAVLMLTTKRQLI